MMTETVKQQPIGLSDRALALVQRHAAALPLAQRDQFLRNLAARLTDAPTDDAVAAAVNIVLEISLSIIVSSPRDHRARSWAVARGEHGRAGQAARHVE
jgi:hypothetical protein